MSKLKKKKILVTFEQQDVSGIYDMQQHVAVWETVFIPLLSVPNSKLFSFLLFFFYGKIYWENVYTINVGRLMWMGCSGDRRKELKEGLGSSHKTIYNSAHMHDHAYKHLSSPELSSVVFVLKMAFVT